MRPEDDLYLQINHQQKKMFRLLYILYKNFLRLFDSSVLIFNAVKLLSWIESFLIMFDRKQMKYFEMIHFFCEEKIENENLFVLRYQIEKTKYRWMVSVWRSIRLSIHRRIQFNKTIILSYARSRIPISHKHFLLWDKIFLF